MFQECLDVDNAARGVEWAESRHNVEPSTLGVDARHYWRKDCLCTL
jgi:hypothetical protein